MLSSNRFTGSRLGVDGHGGTGFCLEIHRYWIIVEERVGPYREDDKFGYGFTH